MTVAGDLTGLYRDRLALITAGTQLRLAAAWGQMFDPADAETSIASIAAAAAIWTATAQAAALTETERWLGALLNASGVSPNGLALPGGLVGSTAAGRSLPSLTRTAVAAYFARLSSGESRQMAAASSLAFLNRVAGSEPYRAANTATIQVAQGDERFTGRVVRITRPGACDFCQQIADRGYIPAHAGFRAHANCRCTPSPQISSHATSRSAIRRGAAAVGER